MPSGEGDARQILGAPDMADAWHAGLGVERPESFEMAGADAADPRRAIGLSHYAGSIAEQHQRRAGAPFQLPRDPERVDEGQPFGFLAPAHAQIVQDMRLSGGDDRRFHPAGIGTAAAVEEDLHRLNDRGSSPPPRRP